MKKKSISILATIALIFSMFCGTVSASGFFDMFNPQNGSPNQKKDIQFARIDEIKDTEITVTLGTLNKNKEDSTQTEQNVADGFTAGDEQLTLKVQDENLKEDLTELKVGDIVRIRYNDQNVLEDIDDASQMKKHDDKRGGQLARIDEITNDNVTITLGTFKENSDNSGQTDQNSTPSENFTAGTEKVTLTFKDDQVKEEISQLKAGDIIFVRYNDQNVLEDVHKADDIKNKNDEKVARIDEITEDKITLTLGNLNKPSEGENNQNTTTPADNFVAGEEKVTLTVSNDELKKNISELKVGDIVFVRYNDQNVLEDIHNINELKDRSDKGQIAKIDEIGNDNIVVTLGTLQKKEQTDNNNQESAPNPTDDFVAGEEKLTLTVSDENVKKELENFKSGDIVSIKYNDQNVLEDIRKFDGEFKRGGHRGPLENNLNNNQNRENTNNQNKENTQSSNMNA